MSMSLRAESSFILDVFAYYDRLYQWKRKVKRNVKRKLSRSSSIKTSPRSIDQDISVNNKNQELKENYIRKNSRNDNNIENV